VLACGLTKRYGRRPLAVFSAAGTCAALLCLAVSVNDTGTAATVSTATAIHAVPAHTAAGLAPVLSIVAYMVFVNIGLVPLPWIMSGEVRHLSHDPSVRIALVERNCRLKKITGSAFETMLSD
jgi:hypothetical protein